MIERNIRLINFYTVCNNAVFFLPIIVPYYATIGLSFRDFLIGEAVFSAVVLLSEIPSGWLSDVWHRRATLILGVFFAVLGYFGLIMADSLTDIIVAQGIIGVAVAMNSGTSSALLYDTLLTGGREAEFRRLQGKNHALSLYAVGIACMIGSLAFVVHPKLPLFLDVIGLIAAMIAMSFVIEPARHKKSADTHIIRDMLETAHYALRGHPEIGGIILVSMVIFTASKLMMWAQQPYYAMLGMPIAMFGTIMAISQFTGGIAGHWSHRIEHWGSNRAKLGTIAGILGISCTMLWLFPSVWLCIPLFLLGTLAYGMGHPVVQNSINVLVGSERRATILSTASLMVHVLSIPTSLVMGLIADKTDIQVAMAFLGAEILVLGGLGVSIWKPFKGPVRA